MTITQGAQWLPKAKTSVATELPAALLSEADGVGHRPDESGGGEKAGSTRAATPDFLGWLAAWLMPAGAGGPPPTAGCSHLGRAQTQPWPAGTPAPGSGESTAVPAVATTWSTRPGIAGAPPTLATVAAAPSQVPNQPTVQPLVAGGRSTPGQGGPTQPSATATRRLPFGLAVSGQGAGSEPVAQPGRGLAGWRAPMPEQNGQNATPGLPSTPPSGGRSPDGSLRGASSGTDGIGAGDPSGPVTPGSAGIMGTTEKPSLERAFRAVRPGTSPVVWVGSLNAEAEGGALGGEPTNAMRQGAIVTAATAVGAGAGVATGEPALVSTPLTDGRAASVWQTPNENRGVHLSLTRVPADATADSAPASPPASPTGATSPMVKQALISAPGEPGSASTGPSGSAHSFQWDQIPGQLQLGQTPAQRGQPSLPSPTPTTPSPIGSVSNRAGLPESSGEAAALDRYPLGSSGSDPVRRPVGFTELMQATESSRPTPNPTFQSPPMGEGEGRAGAAAVAQIGSAALPKATRTQPAAAALPVSPADVRQTKAADSPAERTIPVTPGTAVHASQPAAEPNPPGSSVVAGAVGEGGSVGSLPRPDLSSGSHRTERFAPDRPAGSPSLPRTAAGPLYLEPPQPSETQGVGTRMASSAASRKVPAADRSFVQAPELGGEVAHPSVGRDQPEAGLTGAAGDPQWVPSLPAGAPESSRGGEVSSADSAPVTAATPTSTRHPAAPATSGVHRLQVQLSPTDLGPVQLEVRSRHGELSVQLASALPDTRQLLQRHQGELIDRLELAGLRVHEVSVQPPVDSGWASANLGNGGQSDSGQARHQPAHPWMQAGLGTGSGGEGGGDRTQAGQSGPDEGWTWAAMAVGRARPQPTGVQRVDRLRGGLNLLA